MTKHTVKTLRLKGIPWIYHVFGSGKPLLIAPPFHSDIQRLKPLLVVLGRHYRVIIPELPGIATPKPLPPHFTHTARTYALFLVTLVKKLRLRSYILLGISLGGIIAVRMLRDCLPKPKAIVLFGSPYDTHYIHPAPDQKLALFFYRFFRKNAHTAEWFMRSIVCNPWILAVVFTIRFFGQKHLGAIVAHQVHLTTIMHPKTLRELVDDLLTVNLSDVRRQTTVPTLLLYSQTDNLLDVKQTISGMKRIFPRAETKTIPLPMHAPAGPMTRGDVIALMAPTLNFLDRVTDNR